jgi:cardiolipin synthase
MSFDDSSRTTSVLAPFIRSGPYPLRAGNRIQAWIDGEPAFREICLAIEQAQQSVWATVTFMWHAFRMPDGRGTALDVLERAAERGIDVRLLFWRPDDETAHLRKNAFWGSPAHFELLAERYQRLSIRWDRAHPGYCQHQKSWLIDAERDTARAFIGGINLNPHSVVRPGHRGEGHNHDVYIELTGPSLADVHHNFAQRWNEASERSLSDGGWGRAWDEQLPFPKKLPAECGNTYVQIQRTSHAGRYCGHQPTLDGPPFDLAKGEKSNLEQYCAAIHWAQTSIYLENQFLEVSEIVLALEAALQRGVELVVLLPAQPAVTLPVRESSERMAFLQARARLSNYPNFTLAGIAGLGDDGARKAVYVHSKLMLVDDSWATVGSCNLHHYSLFGNGELNAAFFDPETVKAIRVELFEEYLGMDTSQLGDAEALRLFQQIASENRERHSNGDPNWQGLAFRLDIGSYGQRAQL